MKDGPTSTSQHGRQGRVQQIRSLEWVWGNSIMGSFESEYKGGVQGGNPLRCTLGFLLPFLGLPWPPHSDNISEPHTMFPTLTSFSVPFLESPVGYRRGLCPCSFGHEVVRKEKEGKHWWGPECQHRVEALALLFVPSPVK